MVCWSSFSNCWKLGIRYINLLVWRIFNKSWNICKDLYRSVQIRTKSFFKTSRKRCVFFVEQLISISKTEFMTIQFSNNPGISVRICADLYRFAGSAQHGRLVIFAFYRPMQAICLYISCFEKLGNVRECSESIASFNELLLKSYP